MSINLESAVRDYLVQSAGVDATRLEDPQRRLDDLGLDSLSIVELLFEIEDKFGIRVDNLDAIKGFTLTQLFAFLTELHEQRGAAAPQLAPQVEAAVAHG